MVDEDRARAQIDDRRQVVRDEDERDAARDQLAHAVDALLLEADVADAEHFVDEQHVGVEVRGDREAEPRVHARRVALDRRVDELADAGEVDDRVELARDLGALHAHDRALQVDVLAAGQVGMEAGRHFDQRADAALDLDLRRASAAGSASAA